MLLLPSLLLLLVPLLPLQLLSLLLLLLLLLLQHPTLSLWPSARLMAQADAKECEHCGNYGPWDGESEWQEKWDDWESKLAYYDRTYGALFDEL